MHEEMYSKLVNHARDIAKEEILRYHAKPCFDSDSGADVNTPGIAITTYVNSNITNQIMSYTDKCEEVASCRMAYKMDGCVTEAVCHADNIIGIATYPCPNGCQKGACK